MKEPRRYGGAIKAVLLAFSRAIQGQIREKGGPVVGNPMPHLIELAERSSGRAVESSASVCPPCHLGASPRPSFINCFLFKDNRTRAIESRAITISRRVVASAHRASSISRGEPLVKSPSVSLSIFPVVRPFATSECRVNSKSLADTLSQIIHQRGFAYRVAVNLIYINLLPNSNIIKSIILKFVNYVP